MCYFSPFLKSVLFILIFLHFFSFDQRPFLKSPCLCGILPNSIEIVLAFRACIVRQTMTMSIDTYKAYWQQKENVKHYNAFKVQESNAFFGTILSEAHNYSSFCILMFSSTDNTGILHMLCFAEQELPPGFFFFNRFYQ